MPPGEDDRTVPSPSRAGDAGAATVAAGGGTVGGASGPPGGGADGGEGGAALLLSGSTLAGLVVGALVALLVGSGGGSGPSAATTTSTSTTTTTSTPTTTSTSTTTTTLANAQILSFRASPTTATCPGSVVLTWQTLGASQVRLAVDGASQGPVPGTGGTTLAFACPPLAHTYTLTVVGPSGVPQAQSLTVRANPPPTTSSSTSSTTTSTT